MVSLKCRKKWQPKALYTGIPFRNKVNKYILTWRKTKTCSKITTKGSSTGWMEIVGENKTSWMKKEKQKC